MTTCDTCKRPLWKATGGMGGGLMPDDDGDQCTLYTQNGRACRLIGEGYQRGLLDGRREMLNAVCKTLAEAGHACAVDQVLRDILEFDEKKEGA